MNKNELINDMFKNKDASEFNEEIPNISKNDLNKILDHLVRRIKNALEHGDDVKIANFGKFFPVDINKRMVRNPQTGKTFEVEAKRKGSFKFSHSFQRDLSDCFGKNKDSKTLKESGVIKKAQDSKKKIKPKSTKTTKKK